MFAYCENEPINRADSSGEVWQYIVIGVVGAAINVATTFISAKVTGQEYTWTDAGVSALAGGVVAIPTFGVYISAAIIGGYSISKSYNNGANLGTSLLTGFISATATVGGIGNLASLSGVTLNLTESAITDLVFGTGYNVVSDVINKSITTNYNNTSKNNVTSAPSIIKNLIQTSNTRIVNGKTINISKNSTYVDDRYSNRIYCKVTLY